jgi:hypothetical protein
MEQPFAVLTLQQYIWTTAAVRDGNRFLAEKSMAQITPRERNKGRQRERRALNGDKIRGVTKKNCMQGAKDRKKVSKLQLKRCADCRFRTFRSDAKPVVVRATCSQEACGPPSTTRRWIKAGNIYRQTCRVCAPAARSKWL